VQTIHQEAMETERIPTDTHEARSERAFLASAHNCAWMVPDLLVPASENKWLFVAIIQQAFQLTYLYCVRQMRIAPFELRMRKVPFGIATYIHTTLTCAMYVHSKKHAWGAPTCFCRVRTSAQGKDRGWRESWGRRDGEHCLKQGLFASKQARAVRK